MGEESAASGGLCRGCELRTPTVSLAELAHDALVYSKTQQRTYEDDITRMPWLLAAFRKCVSDSPSTTCAHAGSAPRRKLGCAWQSRLGTRSICLNWNSPLNMGLRLSEMSGLTWENVNMSRRVLTVP